MNRVNVRINRERIDWTFMALFLLTFLGIYGSAHLYAFMKIRSAFSFGAGPGIILGIFMTIMTCAPILVRILETHGYDLSARLFSCIGYTWMGVLFLFFSISILADIYRLVVTCAGFMLHRDMSQYLFSARLAFSVPFVLALGIALYGYFEALDIRTEHITVPSSKIPHEVGSVRIVQVSDVHMGLIVRKQRLDRIIRAIKKVNPDLIVSTGDLVDGQINGLGGLAGEMSELRPRYGKYAVTGNHEFYAGLSQALEITRNAGFRVLRGEAVNISGIITVAGVDDPTAKRFGLSRGPGEEELLSGLEPDTFTVLLKHIPIVREKTMGLYDLQLSGHTHRGQLFPFSLVVRMFFEHISGWYDLDNGSHLYVSRGTGTWGPPMRFLSPPEITVIDIVSVKPG